jgi:uncharacterized protein with von Willebrand factor type A (vWA) domain
MTAARNAPGHLADNVMHFCRTLRAAGMPVGPGKVIDALDAVARTGLRRRDDFYWALHASLVNRRDQHELFDACFHAFWRAPDLLDRLAGLGLPEIVRMEKAPPAARRAAEALRGGRGEGSERAPETREVDAALTASGAEVLQKIDFDRMTAEEVALAKQAMRGLALGLQPVPTRRFEAHPRGARVDARRTLRAALRGHGEAIPLVRRRRLRRPPPIVVLCDISGSMGRYSRMLLHFLHALANDRDRVHVFVFGTRLTNITRRLRQRDVDVALDAVVEAVEDWSGGTRIGDCLRDFNHAWSRRVLGQGAIVLLISDGLDRGLGADLGREMERLHRSCRRLIWLNPLLRYEGFEPKALGVRAIMPHVDEFRPVHNLESLAALAEALSAPERALKAA